MPFRATAGNSPATTDRLAERPEWCLPPAIAAHVLPASIRRNVQFRSNHTFCVCSRESLTAMSIPRRLRATRVCSTARSTSCPWSATVQPSSSTRSPTRRGDHRLEGERRFRSSTGLFIGGHCRSGITKEEKREQPICGTGPIHGAVKSLTRCSRNRLHTTAITRPMIALAAWFDSLNRSHGVASWVSSRRLVGVPRTRRRQELALVSPCTPSMYAVTSMLTMSAVLDDRIVGEPWADDLVQRRASGLLKPCAQRRTGRPRGRSCVRGRCVRACRSSPRRGRRPWPASASAPAALRPAKAHHSRSPRRLHPRSLPSLTVRLPAYSGCAIERAPSSVGATHAGQGRCRTRHDARKSESAANSWAMRIDRLTRLSPPVSPTVAPWRPRPGKPRRCGATHLLIHPMMGRCAASRRAGLVSAPVSASLRSASDVRLASGTARNVFIEFTCAERTAASRSLWDARGPLHVHQGS